LDTLSSRRDRNGWWAETRRAETHGSPRAAVFAGSDAGVDGLLLVRPVAVVVVELVRLGVIRDGDIGPAVPIVVDNRHPEGIAGGVVNAGLLGRVFKPPIAQIVEQPAGVTLVDLGRAV